MIIEKGKEEESRYLMKAVLGESYKDSMDVAEIAEVLHKNGERVRKLGTYRQSQAMKRAWQQHRNDFMIGINRFNRRDGSTDIRKKVAKDLERFKAEPMTGASKYEYFRPPRIGHFDLYEFLSDLTELEAEAFRSAGTFCLEEQYVEYSVFANVVSEDLYAIKKLLKEEKPIPCSLMETLISLVHEELFGKEGDNSQTFCERLSKLSVG